MKRLALVWLVVALTSRVEAQTPAPVPPAPPATTGPASPQVSPKQHLQEAESALAAVPASAASRTETQKNLAQLRKDFADLAKAYAADADRVDKWQPFVYVVERDVVLLIGGGGPEPDDRKGAGLEAEVADAAARDVLKTFRRQVELFYDATTIHVASAPATSAADTPAGPR